MSKMARWGSLLLVFAVLLVGCGSDGDGADESMAPTQADAPTEKGAAGGAQAPSSEGSGPTAVPTGSASANPLVAPRDVIYTASLDVRVDDVEAAIAEAQRQVTTAGGYLFSRQSTSASGNPRATLVFKVPPDVFLATLDRLAALGEEQGRVVTADDVSAQVVDLDSRLKIAQASVDRTRELLARASSVNEIVTLERELATRETALEQLQGQVRVLRGRIAAGTVTLNLAQSAAALGDADDHDGIPSPLDGLRAGWRSLAGTARVTALVLFAIAPWLPVLVVAAWLSRSWIRRRTRRRAARVAAMPPWPGPLDRPPAPPPAGPPPPSAAQASPPHTSPAPVAAQGDQGEPHEQADPLDPDTGPRGS